LPDRSTAFRLYLNPGRAAYVNRYAAPLVDMVRVVGEAGGVTVLAHPWGRHGPDSMPESAIVELAGLGLAGLEVDHQDHTPGDRERLRAIARGLGLVVTGSSDHHGTGKFDHELGCNTTAPEDYERLMELAAAAAARSERTTPEVVR
jgi:3',5'-nucleoside bisphosphate phosphatase